MFYSSYKGHNIPCQATTAPDGLVMDVFCGSTGRHNDASIMRASRTSDILGQVQLGNPIQYKAYTDKGYGLSDHVQPAYKYNLHVGDRMYCNRLMSGERIAIEWGFGRLKQSCPFLTSKINMKVQLCPAVTYIKAAFLLHNTYTLIKGGNQEGLTYICPPAFSAEDYFR